MKNIIAVLLMFSFLSLNAQEGKEFISWDQFHKDTISLGEELKKQGPWDGIIAITRGGLVPAAILAQELNIKMIDTICISSYDDEKKAKSDNFKVLKNAQEKPGKWLIVDDLVDSGDTAKVVKKLFPLGVVACVYAKPKGESSADIFFKRIAQETWIVFPWEKN